MPTTLYFPQFASSPSGTLSSWVAEDGTTVAEGDLIYYAEFSDTILEVVAPYGGRLEIVGIPGGVYEAGAPVGTIA